MQHAGLLDVLSVSAKPLTSSCCTEGNFLVQILICVTIAGSLVSLFVLYEFILTEVERGSSVTPVPFVVLSCDTCLALFIVVFLTSAMSVGCVGVLPLIILCGLPCRISVRTG